MLEHISGHGVHYIDEYGQRPLHRASRRGHAAAVRYIDIISFSKMSDLIAKTLSLSMLNYRMLLQFGSDPNACDKVGGYSAIQVQIYTNTVTSNLITSEV